MRTIHLKKGGIERKRERKYTRQRRYGISWNIEELNSHMNTKY